MGLYKRKDSDSWWVFLSYRGTQLRKSCRTTDRTLAEQCEREWRQELDTKGHTFRDPLKNATDKTGVYFIRVEGTDYVKIGWAINVEHRLMDLQIANPHILVLEAYIPCADPLRFETSTHVHFTEKHVRGEWFRLTQDDVEAFLQLVEGKDKNGCA